jgi:hypothetical protein
MKKPAASLGQAAGYKYAHGAEFPQQRLLKRLSKWRINAEIARSPFPEMESTALPDPENPSQWHGYSYRVNHGCGVHFEGIGERQRQNPIWCMDGVIIMLL